MTLLISMVAILIARFRGTSSCVSAAAAALHGLCLGPYREGRPSCNWKGGLGFRVSGLGFRVSGLGFTWLPEKSLD